MCQKMEPGRKVAVSVYIATYNQEDYIKDALEGALKQKTNFLYEIIVHDDASTDSTVSILKEYEKRYPDKIVALYEDTNTYDHPEYASKRAVEAARGKYMALCDGDDYWTDENKLQMQYDFMESHEDFALCTHNSLAINDRTGESRLYSQVDKTGEILQGDVIERGCTLFHSSSHFFRLQDWKQKYNDQPMFDLNRVVYLTDAGRVMFLNKCMSVYRVCTPGSWSEMVSDPFNGILDMAKGALFMRHADEQTNYRWHDHFEKYIKSTEDSFLGIMSQFYRGFSFKYRLLWLAKWTRDCFGLFPYWLKIRLWINEQIEKKKKRN